jgi:hypothetical protein
MYQLTQTEITCVSGGFAPVSFIAGYILGEDDRHPATGIVGGWAAGVLVGMPNYLAWPPGNAKTAIICDLIGATIGYGLSLLTSSK